MDKPNKSLLVMLNKVKAKIQLYLPEHKAPMVIALDGGSGAGKTTLASLLEDNFFVSLIPLDDFFSANIPDKKWEQFTVEEKLANVFDWKRLRKDVIEPLLHGKSAKWCAFDFESQLPDGTYQRQTESKKLKPAEIILIDGAYSASSEIADLVNLTILVDVPHEKRHSRLDARECDKKFLEKWHKRWNEVEDYYFNQVRPKSYFDLVVPN